VTVAFGAAPLVTAPFTGYDPSLFPVAIGRPAIQPAGYAFAIWSVIYLWLILHAGFGLWKRAVHPDWARVRLPLAVAIGVGVVWLWIAGQSATWGTVTIWIMAFAALAAFLRAPSEPDRWLLSGPLAIFAGWLTAAAAVQPDRRAGHVEIDPQPVDQIARIAFRQLVGMRGHSPQRPAGRVLTCVM
jgi:hypothetical protein